MKIILINGSAGHGKDTFAELIFKMLSDRNLDGHILHFADYLKYCCNKYLGWDGNKHTPEGRSVLQRVGGEMRETYDNFWADTLFRLIKGIFNEDDFIIIPDLRYVNEADTAYNYFSPEEIITINISRINEDGSDYVNPFMSEDNKAHQSENDMKNYIFDYYITNRTYSELIETADLFTSVVFPEDN